MNKELTLNQFVAQLNKAIPAVNSYKSIRIHMGLITECRDAYHHFIVSKVHCYGGKQEKIDDLILTGDEIYDYIHTFYVKIYRKDKHLDKKYIDYEEHGNTTMKVKVINHEETYKNNIYYKWGVISSAFKDRYAEMTK